MARELITIQSKDGKAKKTIAKSEYALYATSGWKEIDKKKTIPMGGYSSPYNSTDNK